MYHINEAQQNQMWCFQAAVSYGEKSYFNIEKAREHPWESEDHFFLPVVSVSGNSLTLTLLLLSLLSSPK